MLSPDQRGINVAIVGIGNCASSLVQGVEHYRSGTNDTTGLMHHEIGGYEPSDIRVRVGASVVHEEQVQVARRAQVAPALVYHRAPCRCHRAPGRAG